MIIEIPDNSPDKLVSARIQITIQALAIYNNNKMRSAKFIGISIRTLRNWINRTPELARFRKTCPVAGNEAWQKYSNTPLWKIKTLV